MTQETLPEPIYIQGPTGDNNIHGVRFGAPRLPPGYRVDWIDSGYQWVRLVCDVPRKDVPHDHDLESYPSWDRWTAFCGAWAHYKKAKRLPDWYATNAREA